MAIRWCFNVLKIGKGRNKIKEMYVYIVSLNVILVTDVLKFIILVFHTHLSLSRILSHNTFTYLYCL